MKKINEGGLGCGMMVNQGQPKSHQDKPQNYMFFGNLQIIKRAIDALLEMEPHMIDGILTNGHDWAADHIATSKDDIQEVADFFINKMGKVSHHPSIMPFVKTFESYVNEVSGKKWREIETDLRGRKMDMFADRVASHSKKYGTNQVAEVKLVGLPVSGYERTEVILSVTDLELRNLSGSNFKIVGRDSDWGTVVIHGFITNEGVVQMFESERMPLLAADRKNAMDLIKFLVDEGVAENSQLEWRRFTNGYVSFKEAYKI
jgi:hypothetical protein